MNAHFKISLVKSILKIIGCIGAVATCWLSPAIPIVILGGTFLGAELLGILEEIKDNRK